MNKSALEKLNLATQNFTHVKLRAAIAKEKKPLEKHDEKNPKKESVQKT
jgi:hypothetical protein